MIAPRPQTRSAGTVLLSMTATLMNQPRYAHRGGAGGGGHGSGGSVDDEHDSDGPLVFVVGREIDASLIGFRRATGTPMDGSSVSESDAASPDGRDDDRRHRRHGPRRATSREAGDG